MSNTWSFEQIIKDEKVLKNVAIRSESLFKALNDICEIQPEYDVVIFGSSGLTEKKIQVEPC